MSVDGEKLKLIRMAMHWKQSSMAELLGVQNTHLSAMEAGVRPIPEHVADRMSFLTGFAPAYLRTPIKADIPAGTLLYRKQRDKFRQSEKQQVYCQLVFDAFEPLTTQVKPRTPRLSGLSECTPIEAANHVRNALGIRPGTPISNLTHLAESAGIRVVGIGRPVLEPQSPQSEVELDHEGWDDDFSGFAFWTSSNLPVVFLRTDIKADLINWALGHELIHLVLHRTFHGNVRQAEKDAQLGNQEFFMPADAMLAALQPGSMTVAYLTALAARWNVTLTSLVIRCFELGLMTDRVKSYYMGAIKNGAGSEIHLTSQKPRYYRQMSELLFGSPLSIREVARATGSSSNLIGPVLKAHMGSATNLTD
jgi:Zn-dependent peptidase ImmA (M78 family)/transcriptional regulator with XRE-family HTH domain